MLAEFEGFFYPFPIAQDFDNEAHDSVCKRLALFRTALWLQSGFFSAAMILKLHATIEYSISSVSSVRCSSGTVMMRRRLAMDEAKQESGEPHDKTMTAKPVNPFLC